MADSFHCEIFTKASAKESHKKKALFAHAATTFSGVYLVRNSHNGRDERNENNIYDENRNYLLRTHGFFSFSRSL